MKKITILGLSLIASLTTMAQNDVVKDVERAIKGSAPDFPAALTAIKPALTHEESKDDAKTWYIAGKTCFDYYDNLYAQQTIGREIDQKLAGNTLLEGYDYMMTALPLDSVRNEKGKVKTKHSKNIVKAITSHHNDFLNAGLFCWQSEDWAGAYKAWGIWVDMPYDKSLGDDAPVAQPDSIVCQTVYNQGLAALQMQDNENALKTLLRAKDMGYNEKGVYDFAISAAVQTQKFDIVYSLSEEAHKFYGKEDTKYLQIMIDIKVENKQYDEAKILLDQAVAADPENASIYALLGSIQIAQKDYDNAEKTLKIAIEKDPTLAKAHFLLGQMLWLKAAKIDEGSQSLSTADYNNVAENEIYPLLRQSASYLENAYRIDPDNNQDARMMLRQIYYNLKDDVNLKRVESM